MFNHSCSCNQLTTFIALAVEHSIQAYVFKSSCLSPALFRLRLRISTSVKRNAFMSAAIVRLGRWRPDHFTEGKGSGSGGSPCPAADSWVSAPSCRLGPRRSYDRQQEQRENLFAKYTLYMHYTINYYSSLSKKPRQDPSWQVTEYSSIQNNDRVKIVEINQYIHVTKM